MTTPTQPQEKRSTRYPVIVEHALSLYMLETYDGIERAKKIADTLKKKITDLLALDPQVSPVRLVIANQNDPDGNPQSYNYAYIGAFFHNVTRSELESYAKKLNDEFARDRKYLFTHPDGVELPAPEAYVPEYEWVREQMAELNSLSEKSKAIMNADGSMNDDAIQAAAQEIHDKALGATGEKIKPSGTGSVSAGGTSPAIEIDDDFDEMDLI